MAKLAACTPPKLDRKYDDWEAKDAMRTLQSAHDIVSNPGLHKAAQRHAKKQMRSLKKVADAKPLSARKR